MLFVVGKESVWQCDSVPVWQCVPAAILLLIIAELEVKHGQPWGESILTADTSPCNPRRMWAAVEDPRNWNKMLPLLMLEQTSRFPQ